MASLPPRNFRELVWRISPASLRGPWGTRFMQFLGLRFDKMTEGAQTAALVSMPGSDYFSPDALEPLGNEVRFRRFPGESNDLFLDRIQHAWDIWPKSGSPSGMLDMLTRYGLAATIFADREFDWDGTSWWSRLFVLLTDHPWSNDGNWDDPGVWDDGGTWDSTATVEEVSALRNIVNEFKQGHEIVKIILVGMLELWDFPAGTWDEPGDTWSDSIAQPIDIGPG